MQITSTKNFAFDKFIYIYLNTSCSRQGIQSCYGISHFGNDHQLNEFQCIVKCFPDRLQKMK